MTKLAIKQEMDTIYALFKKFTTDPNLTWEQAVNRVDASFQQLYREKYWKVPKQDEDGRWDITVSPIFTIDGKKKEKIVL